MNRQRGSELSVRLVLGLAVVVAVALFADASCQVADAVVVEKREGVEELIDPYWRPTREVVVRFAPDVSRAVAIPWQPERWSAGVVTPIAAGLEEYDRLRPGAAVQVRYFPPLPDVARLTDQSLTAVVFEPLWEELRESGILFGLLLLAWLIVATRCRWWPGFLTRNPRKLILLPVHLAMLQLLPLMLLGTADLLPAPTGPSATALATLQDVRVIRTIGHTRFGSSRQTMSTDLPRPFARVLLRFVPAGGDQPVVAVDDVAPESLATVNVGDVVAIAYPIANPRLGWLADADRSHRLENRLYVHGLITWPFVVVVVLGQAVSWLVWGVGRVSRAGAGR